MGPSLAACLENDEDDEEEEPDDEQRQHHGREAPCLGRGAQRHHSLHHLILVTSERPRPAYMITAKTT